MYRGKLYTEDFFNAAINQMLLNIKRDKDEKVLIQEGFSRKDIDLSYYLMACIALIDEIIFPGEDIVYNFSPRKDKHGKSIAAYQESKKDQSEQYNVYVKDMFEKFEYEKKQKQVLIHRGKLHYDQSPPLSLEGAMLQTAVHEVRHRLQFRAKLRILKRKHIRHARGELRDYLRWTTFLMDAKKEEYTKEGVSVKKIRKETNSLEIDAETIAMLTLARMCRGISCNNLRRTIRLQSPKV